MKKSILRESSFWGGEPLTRADFIDIAEYLETKGIFWGLNSNGLLINSSSLERMGRLHYFDSITLSLEGPNAEINNEIRGKKVFDILINRIQLLNRFKKENPSAAFKININTVVTSRNYKYIPEIIELCRRENIDELSLLEFIEEGNGVGKSLSLNKEQLLETIKVVAEIYTKQKKGKPVINPRFVRPYAVDYAKICLNLDFPEVAHGCGAGSTLVFLDNCGRIYSCDRYRNYHGAETGKYVLKEDTWDIFDSKEFVEPFSKYFGEEIYKTLTPCKECKYLYETCMPCYLCVKENNRKMGQCELFQKKIIEKTMIE